MAGFTKLHKVFHEQRVIENMNILSRICLLFLSVVGPLSAFERVPKQYALEVGGVYAHKNEVSGDMITGAIVMFDYSWQLSGLDGSRPASFISVPIGYTYYKADPKLSILSYGWTVRHNILKDKSVLPFVGYGLLLNQLSYEEDKGKRFGHHTRFDVGCEWLNEKPLHLFTKIEWSITRFPDRLKEESDWMYTFAIKVGARFCKPVRERK